ncbi:RING finger and transmembrane domain-containing protein 2 [Camellia lanceoleosa]|uniref:RING finger and transmembrane domain-containing protein 2 n=1 Tax=Camellia lanceoleosa TaxID=1840588 RepID=A0ACC0HWV3_9ERIC|nr:RING finger and transmembrane domain-containing protein 2 [Camellia lanceoleosa]
MEASGGNLDEYRGSSLISSSNSRRYGMQLLASNFFHSPLSTLLEYSGILRTRSNYLESESSKNSNGMSVGYEDHIQNDSSPVANNGGEVSIRIIGAGEQEHDRLLPPSMNAQNEAYVQPIGRTNTPHYDRGVGESGSQSLNGDGEAVDGAGSNSRDSSYQRYDIYFFVTIWIAAVMFKSNDILRKQTALKGERKIPILIGISFVFGLHVIVVYWWYWNDDILYLLIMVPPKAIPPFWHAIFIIMVSAMVLKCILLMYHKNSRGQNYRRQGQMLTLVEYLLLLYRALLPAPVWYRFFLNKEYGSLFSSLMIGLYLTFKLTAVVEKVQSFFAALKALSRKESHYGAYATSEQVAMVLKCILLMYYKNSRGRNYGRQGQMLTLVEYLLLLYRALLPAPVWYRFFLNKEYGSLFSSLMTGLYLTFKLTSVVEKVLSFFAALKALSRKESHYGAYATSEQVVQFSFFMHPTKQFP